MRTRPSFRRVLAVFLAVPVAAGLAAAGVRVKLEDVPKPAVKAVQDRFPKATIRYADKETDGTFELAIKDGEKLLDVGVTAEGRLLNVKEEVAADKLPKAVTDGLEKKHPGAKVVEAEKVIVIDGKKEKVTYELKVKADQKTFEVVVGEDGKVVE
jgi:hypothetical protein